MYGPAEQAEWVEREVSARTHSFCSLWPASCILSPFVQLMSFLVDLPRDCCLCDCAPGVSPLEDKRAG